MKVLRFGFWWLLVPVAVTVLFVLFLLFTTGGARLAATLAESVLTPLSIRQVDGSIAYGLRAEQVVWSQPEVTVSLDGLASVWNPDCFWQAQICIDSLIAGRLQIVVPPDDSPDVDDDSALTPIEMPLLVLPWQLRIDQFHLAELEIVAGGRTTRVDPVTFKAQWSGTRVVIERFQASTTDTDIGAIDASLSGVIEMRSEWPFHAILAASYIPPLEQWHKQHLEFSGEGNIRNLLLKGDVKANIMIPDMEPLKLAAELRSQSLDSEIKLKNLQGAWNGAPLQASGNAAFTHDGLLTLQQMQLQWGKNTAVLDGTLQEQWNVHAALALTEPQLIAPDAQGQFTGSADISGLRDDPLIALQLASDELSLPDFQVRELALQANVAPRSFKSLNATAHASKLYFQQEKLEDIALELQGNAQHHTLSVSGSRNQQQISAAAQGTLDAQRLDWHGQIEQLQLQLDKTWQVTLEKALPLEWKHQTQLLTWDRFCLLDQVGKVCSQGTANLSRMRGDIQLDVDRFELANLHTFIGDEVQLQGAVNARLRVKDGFSLPDIAGSLEMIGLVVQQSNRDQAVLANGHVGAEFTGNQVTLSTTADVPPGVHWESETPVVVSWQSAGINMDNSCWTASRVATELLPVAHLGQLCLQASTGKSGLQMIADLDLAIAAALQPWLPDELQMEGQLTAHGEAVIKGNNAKASLQADLQQGMLVLLRGEDNEPIRMPLEKLQMNANLQQQHLVTTLDLMSSRLGNGSAAADVTLDAQNPSLEGHARFSGFDVQVIQPLVPQLSELQGVVSMDMQAKGPVATPEINGQIEIRNVQVQSAGIPMVVDDLDAKLVFTGNRGDLSGKLKSGKGRATIDGDLTRTDTGWQARIHLDGKNIPVYQPPDIRFMVQPDLTLLATAESIQLQGTVLANNGFMVIKPLPPDAISVSSDVEFIDERGNRLQRATDYQLGMNVVASVEPNLRIRGFGGEIRPKGAIRINLDRSGLMVGRGTIDIEEGSYTGYGQQLTIRKGQAIFNGPINQPYINLEAVRAVDAVVAGIRVSGPASEPVATLFSEPSLPDSQILYYIITGKAPGAATEDENTAVRNALLSVGLMGGQPLARDIASKVGIDDLQMGTTGSGEETAVTVGGYLNSRTYLQYGISVFEPVNTVTVRYRLRENLFLEAVSGIASALDVLYSFEF